MANIFRVSYFRSLLHEPSGELEFIFANEWKKDFFRGYLISRIGGPFAEFANISGRDFWH